jgi:ABC-type phosphate transport system substrate-binding protein
VKFKQSWLIVFFVTFMYGASSLVAAEDIIVVVHKENANDIDLAYVAKIYSGAVRSWPDGNPITAIDYPEDADARIRFSAKVLNRSVANMRAIWSQNIFAGKGLPPQVVKNEDDIKRTVLLNKYSIAYLPASLVEGNMRIIAR